VQTLFSTDRIGGVVGGDVGGDVTDGRGRRVDLVEAAGEVGVEFAEGGGGVRMNAAASARDVEADVV
jgi:hypothetical protein